MIVKAMMTATTTDDVQDENAYAYGANSDNNYVEVMDTRTGLVSVASTNFLPSGSGGLSFACLIPLPEKNSFVVTGGSLEVKGG